MSDLTDRLETSARDLRAYAELAGVANDIREAADRLTKLEELRSLTAGGHPGPDRGYVLLRSYTFTEETHQRIQQLLEELKGE